jgi:hypothetical protein
MEPLLLTPTYSTATKRPKRRPTLSKYGFFIPAPPSDLILGKKFLRSSEVSHHAKPEPPPDFNFSENREVRVCRLGAKNKTGNASIRWQAGIYPPFMALPEEE